MASAFTQVSAFELVGFGMSDGVLSDEWLDLIWRAKNETSQSKRHDFCLLIIHLIRYSNLFLLIYLKYLDENKVTFFHLTIGPFCFLSG